MNFEKLASKKKLEKTVKSLNEKGYRVSIVNDKKDALERIKKIIPGKVSVMNGSSVTLEQIGYIDYLKSKKHKWIDLHKKVSMEDDQIERNKLRRKSTLSEYYLGSVHALTENGEFIIASNTGSQLPHIAYNSNNLIFVVSTKKIVKDIDEAFDRLQNHVYPKEDKHLMELYGTHTAINKILIFNGEAKFSLRKINFILVKENLGY